MHARNLLLLMLVLGPATLTLADELEMKNGSVLIGTLVRAENDHLIFDTPFAGKITVKQENIESIRTTVPVTLMMADGRVFRDREIVTNETEQKVVVSHQGRTPVTYPIRDIDRVNPHPWRLGDGYKWSGKTSAAVESERGNSDTDEWDLIAKSVWRSLEDRYTLKGDLELDESNGEKNTDDWKVFAKYDRFQKVIPEDYYGVKLRFEYDRFADLDLRTIIGPHIGRQFFETKFLTLEGEVGPVWVDEQFAVAEDNDFPGAMWLLEAESDVVGYGTTIYAIHDGIFNFDASDEIILNTTLGIKVPLMFGFETAFEAKFEYDGGAVQEVDDWDETYNFRIGYTW
jgi:putative salt-induced outer membrane protein YdiY